jgi:TfoX/Sxy family transcriptional regulator of competence genes
MADWAKKDEALIERVDGLLATAPVRRKNMFGTAAWFLDSNDNIFAGAWGTSVMLRVDEERTKNLIETGMARPFDPMGGRPMREYVLLEGEQVAEDEDLLNWLEQASEFVVTLPPKTSRNRRKPGKTR